MGGSREPCRSMRVFPFGHFVRFVATPSGFQRSYPRLAGCNQASSG